MTRQNIKSLFFKRPSYLLCLFFVILLCTACGNNRQKFAWPFYKQFSGVVNGRFMQIFLYRDTAFNIHYSGYLIDSLQQTPVEIQGGPKNAANSSAIQLNFRGQGDTSYVFAANINASASSMEGRVTRLIKDIPFDSGACVFSESGATDKAFTYYSVSGSGKLPGKSGYNYSTDAQFVWPLMWKDEPVRKKFVRTINGVLGIKNDTTTQPAADFIATQMATLNKQYGTTDMTASAAENETNESVSVKILYQNNRHITIVANYSHYESGMAHGQSSSTITLFSLQTGERIRLDEILNNAGIAKLPSLLAAYFRKAHLLKPGEPLTKAGLFRNHIEPNKNFYLTGNALIFHYNNYEIAPFVMGEFDIALPLAEFRENLLMK